MRTSTAIKLLILAGSLGLLAFSILLWIIWPWVKIKLVCGYIFTFLNVFGLIFWLVWRKNRKTRPQHSLLLKVALIAWFLSIILFLGDALLGGNATYRELNTVVHNNKNYRVIASSGCTIECFYRINVYRCELGDFICLPVFSNTFVPDFLVKDADFILGSDAKSGELNLLQKGKIIYTFS